MFSVSCPVSYTCSNYERFRRTTCICQKRQSFLSMCVTQATGEENYLSMSLLEPTDFALQVSFDVWLYANVKLVLQSQLFCTKQLYMVFSVGCPVSYTCSNYERFRCTTCICQKRQSFLSMYVTQATGEENYLSVTLLEPADFVWQINCVCAVICQCKA